MSLPNVQENNQEILNDIQSLQAIEKSLFTTLESNPDLTTAQQEEIINKISDISSMRINLYHTLNDVNGYFQHALTNSQGTLQEQATAIGIVEAELNKAKADLSLLEEEKNNKIRLIEINNFYGDKYADHTSLMKYIMFMLIPIIISLALVNKNIIPMGVFYIVLVISTSIGGFFILTKLKSIWNRDNMNYQEFNWYFDASSAPAAVVTDVTNPWTSAVSFCTSVDSASTALASSSYSTTDVDMSGSTTSTESFSSAKQMSMPIPSNTFRY